MTAAITWMGIGSIVVTSTAGDVLQAHAMRQIGDLGAIRQRHGLMEASRRVLSSPAFMLGMLFMAMAFFSLLISLSWGSVSVVGPASASLTFIANAIAAQIFLKERVDHRRWLAALFVAAGVALLAR